MTYGYVHDDIKNLDVCPLLVSPADGFQAPGTTVLLNWNASSGADSYNVYLWIGTEIPMTPQYTTTETEYLLEDLFMGTTFNWAITPVVDGVETKVCLDNFRTFTTAGSSLCPIWTFRDPSVVHPLYGVTADYDVGLIIDWPAVPGADSYRVYFWFSNTPSPEQDPENAYFVETTETSLDVLNEWGNGTTINQLIRVNYVIDDIEYKCREQSFPWRLDIGSYVFLEKWNDYLIIGGWGGDQDLADAQNYGPVNLIYNTETEAPRHYFNVAMLKTFPDKIPEIAFRGDITLPLLSELFAPQALAGVVINNFLYVLSIRQVSGVYKQPIVAAVSGVNNLLRSNSPMGFVYKFLITENGLVYQQEMQLKTILGYTEGNVSSLPYYDNKLWVMRESWQYEDRPEFNCYDLDLSNNFSIGYISLDENGVMAEPVWIAVEPTLSPPVYYPLSLFPFYGEEVEGLRFFVLASRSPTNLVFSLFDVTDADNPLYSEDNALFSASASDNGNSFRYYDPIDNIFLIHNASGVAVVVDNINAMGETDGPINILLNQDEDNYPDTIERFRVMRYIGQKENKKSYVAFDNYAFASLNANISSAGGGSSLTWMDKYA